MCRAAVPTGLSDPFSIGRLSATIERAASLEALLEIVCNLIGNAAVGPRNRVLGHGFRARCVVAKSITREAGNICLPTW